MELPENRLDIYGNASLFSKLSRKLIESCSIESISVKDQAKNPKALEPSDITKWLADADQVKAAPKPVNEDNYGLERNSADTFSLESYEQDKPGMMIHKNIIKK